METLSVQTLLYAMKYIRTNSLKRLFSLKRRSFEEAVLEKKAPNPNGEEDRVGVVGTESFQRPIWKCFSFEEISEATDGFSSDNLVGKEGYTEVYKGVLRNGDEIAVKRLTKTASDERKEKEFLTEIGTINSILKYREFSIQPIISSASVCNRRFPISN
ncbi:receptor-like cytosolic serine/threonine-protein kinase RBK2 [Humulus lupulus]|uniref:receptor-like cytosolic serine/threonine-protein kinase RBK2 n=1 Tax=Humulus lupulus TaxID=3486 RepID=UPI002B4035A3|nr:receptor-like cytosolic serine/threonine-protein kinase RBK2 [Humulus lupulus]